MRKKLVVGNWKMNGNLRHNQSLLTAICAAAPAVPCEMAVCVPFPYLAQAAGLLAECPVALGAQNVSEHPPGAFTGEVAAGMLRDLGCRFVLVGHSERRSLFGETCEVIAAKFVAAQQVGLVPVLCVGESLAERERGETLSVVLGQIDAVVRRSGIGALRDAVLAYEPVWAIGTGVTASPQQAQAVHAALRAHLAAQDEAVAAELKILYGGSVKPQNAAELFAQPDIDGGLIGGAALVADDFLAICHAVA